MATAGTWLPAGFTRLLLGAARGELGLSRPMDICPPPLRVAVQGPQVGRFPAEQAGPEHPLPCFRADVCGIYTPTWSMQYFINQVRLPRDWVPRPPCPPLLMPRRGQTPPPDMPRPS